jgi:hypothetical protein
MNADAFVETVAAGDRAIRSSDVMPARNTFEYYLDEVRAETAAGLRVQKALGG